MFFVCLSAPSLLLCVCTLSLSLTHTGEIGSVMEELSAVGEQVFDAECILNKRVKKVKKRIHVHARST